MSFMLTTKLIIEIHLSAIREVPRFKLKRKKNSLKAYHISRPAQLNKNCVSEIKKKQCISEFVKVELFYRQLPIYLTWGFISVQAK